MPDWSRLLKEPAERARVFEKSDVAGYRYLMDLIGNKEYLEAADLLQDLLDTDLDLLLSSLFDVPAEPSKIHISVARIPFTMAITTNYDRLL